ncbi:MAG: alpha/beta hydrolase [Acidimicrobiales bacterium]
MPFLHTEDHTSLAYDDWGSGPSVVFVHGWVLGADAWEYQTSMLSEQGFRCVAYDRRGCGRSDRPGTGYDFDTLADDLAALIEHLDLSEVTLVGHSMGCGDIARYLTRHGPSRIARAALIAPTTPFLLQTPDNPEGVDASVFDFMVSQLVADRPQFLALAAPSFFGQALTPELLQWGVGLARRSPL